MQRASTLEAVTGVLSRVREISLRHHVLVVLSYLTILEVSVFGPLMKRVGFYLDDWNMLYGLHYTPGWVIPRMFNYLLIEPRVLIRPVEAIYFTGLYCLFGAKPLWWHVVNCSLEVVAGLLLYLCVFTLSNSRVLSCVAAALFLLSPVHDSTHYWVLASSATFSMALYLGSLLCSMQAARLNRPMLHVGAVLLFGVSIFNYETFIPLCCLNILFAYLLSSASGTVENTEAFKPTVSWRAPLVQSSAYAASVAGMYIWSHVIAPKIGSAYVHGVSFSATTMADTLTKGFSLNLLPEQIDFYTRVLAGYLGAGDQVASVAIVITAATLAIVALFIGEASVKDDRRLLLIGIGAVAVIPLALCIFGLNPEYSPTLLTGVNRINYGPSIGSSILYAVILVAAAKLGALGSAFRPAMIAAGTSALLIFFATCDIAYAKPWALSWVMQQQVYNVLRNNSGKVSDSSCLILAGSPRYLMWAPVFDGVWDFQSMARLVLNDRRLNAGVISPRLHLSTNQVSDISSGALCGTYSLKGMTTLVATEGKFIKINSAQEFVDVVRHKGMLYEPDQTVADRLQRDLLASSRPSHKTY